jgi:cyclase
MVRVIPCLDVLAEGVVKGVNFENLRRVGDPVELAARYDGEGADELVFLDVGATVQGRRPLLAVLEEVSRRVFLPVTAGGGVRGLGEVEAYLAAGADKVAVNTAAVARPALLTEAARRFGSQCVVLAMDVRSRPGGWEVFVEAGRRGTGLDALEWAREAEGRGAGELLVTSMDRDGTGAGFDTGLYGALARASRLPLIASGGAGEAHHFAEAARAGATGVLAAGLFHGGRLTIPALKERLQREGIEVRPWA